MMIGDESQRCASCEELEWQCQCPPEPDEIVNDPYPDPSEDDIDTGIDDRECGEYEGMSFEDSMMLKHPVIDYGYPDLGW